MNYSISEIKGARTFDELSKFISPADLESLLDGLQIPPLRLEVSERGRVYGARNGDEKLAGIIVTDYQEADGIDATLVSWRVLAQHEGSVLLTDLLKCAETQLDKDTRGYEQRRLSMYVPLFRPLGTSVNQFAQFPPGLQKSIIDVERAAYQQNPHTTLGFDAPVPDAFRYRMTSHGFIPEEQPVLLDYSTHFYVPRYAHMRSHDPPIPVLKPALAFRKQF